MTTNEAINTVKQLLSEDFVYPIELANGIFLSKTNSNFSISYPDKRTQRGTKKEFGLTEAEVIKVIKRKLK